jgi:hypothetical protein
MSVKPKLRHWLDCNQICQILHHAPEWEDDNSTVSLSRVWPLVLERVNGLFRLPEATEKRADVQVLSIIYFKVTSQMGLFLSALLLALYRRKGRTTQALQASLQISSLHYLRGPISLGISRQGSHGD